MSFKEQAQRGSWDGLMIETAWVEIVERSARARVLRRLTVSGEQSRLMKTSFYLNVLAYI